MEKPYDDHFEKFLSAYPGYVRKERKSLLPPGTMERVNAALDRARPTKEEWAKQMEKLGDANLVGANRP